MKSIKVRNFGAFCVCLLLKITVFGLTSCSSDEVTVNEGVADDGTPLGPGTELSVGLEEDLDPDAQLEGVNLEPEAEEFKEYLVTAYYLNVRRGPANTFPVVRVLRKNQVVKGSLTDSGWIKLSKDEFVSSKYMKSR